MLNPSPSNGFFATFAGNWGLKMPQAYLEFSAHSDKNPTASPMFSWSNFLIVVLPISWDVDVRQKSKMAAKLPDIPITLLFFTDTVAK